MTCARLGCTWQEPQARERGSVAGGGVGLANDPKAVGMYIEAPTPTKAQAVAEKVISQIAGMKEQDPTSAPLTPGAVPHLTRGSRPAGAAPRDTHPGRRTQAAWTGGRTTRGSRGYQATGFARAPRAARHRAGPRPGRR